MLQELRPVNLFHTLLNIALCSRQVCSPALTTGHSNPGSLGSLYSGQHPLILPSPASCHTVQVSTSRLTETFTQLNPTQSGNVLKWQLGNSAPSCAAASLKCNICTQSSSHIKNWSKQLSLCVMEYSTSRLSFLILFTESIRTRKDSC